MNKIEIKELQNVIMGNSHSDSILNKAMAASDSLETTICLTALNAGHSTFESRMTLQDFVCRLSRFEYDEECSSCCGAEVLDENDGAGICASCHEHCEVFEEDCV